MLQVHRQAKDFGTCGAAWTYSASMGIERATTSIPPTVRVQDAEPRTAQRERVRRAAKPNEPWGDRSNRLHRRRVWMTSRWASKAKGFVADSFGIPGGSQTSECWPADRVYERVIFYQIAVG